LIPRRGSGSRKLAAALAVLTGLTTHQGEANRTADRTNTAKTSSTFVGREVRKAFGPAEMARGFAGGFFAENQISFFREIDLSKR
jgi:hypothetical protein